MDDLFPEEEESFYASLQLVSAVTGMVTVNPALTRIIIVDDDPIPIPPSTPLPTPSPTPFLPGKIIIVLFLYTI